MLDRSNRQVAIRYDLQGYQTRRDQIPGDTNIDSYVLDRSGDERYSAPRNPVAPVTATCMKVRLLKKACHELGSSQIIAKFLVMVILVRVESSRTLARSLANNHDLY